LYFVLHTIDTDTISSSYYNHNKIKCTPSIPYFDDSDNKYVQMQYQIVINNNNIDFVSDDNYNTTDNINTTIDDNATNDNNDNDNSNDNQLRIYNCQYSMDQMIIIVIGISNNYNSDNNFADGR
jgi:hypothetical protein